MTFDSHVRQGKRIVLTTHGTLGDLHPYLAIALEMQRRGHAPVIAAPRQHQQNVESTGLEFRPIRPDLPTNDLERHRRLTEPRRGLERVIREWMMPAVRETYDDLLNVVQQHKAELLVSQILVFAAPLIAEKIGIRWISTELQPGAFMSAYDPPVMAPAPSLATLRRLGPGFHKPLFALSKLPAESWSRSVRELRRELGLPQGRNALFEGRHSPRLVLALFSHVIGSPQPDWPNNVLVTGFPFFDEPNSALPIELKKFLSEGEPPIVFTLGSSAVSDPGNFYGESISAVNRLKTRAVLLVGNAQVASLPQNIIAVPYAPYQKIFTRASVIVHHGGVGTTGQALRAGKPMLVMPFGGDQYDNAARIERLGIGRVVMRKRYRAEHVAGDLSDLLTRSDYRDRALKIRSVVEKENGVSVACDAIEEQLQLGRTLKMVADT